MQTYSSVFQSGQKLKILWRADEKYIKQFPFLLIILDTCEQHLHACVYISEARAFKYDLNQISQLSLKVWMTRQDSLCLSQTTCLKIYLTQYKVQWTQQKCLSEKTLGKRQSLMGHSYDIILLLCAWSLFNGQVLKIDHFLPNFSESVPIFGAPYHHAPTHSWVSTQAFGMGIGWENILQLYQSEHK